MIRGLILTAVGIGLGVVGSLALAKVLESLLFGIKATNASVGSYGVNREVVISQSPGLLQPWG